MGSSIQYAIKHRLIHPPSFLNTNLQYECIMGSFAYGCSNGENSDVDIYSFCTPTRNILFPHTDGYIVGFDNDYPKFEQWQEHHVFDKSSGKTFDFCCFNIVNYFKLLYDNNPNIIDSLFVPEFCVKHITKVGQLVRDNRKLFLSKRCWERYRGYACSQMKKIESKTATGKRAELVEKYGYDTKFSYHLIRLLDEAEMIMVEQDLDLTRKNDEWKAIRNGEWTYDRLVKEFEQRKLSVEEKAIKSTLREQPDKDRIRELLYECLEIQYGDISSEITKPNALKIALQNIDTEINKIKTEIYK